MSISIEEKNIMESSPASLLNSELELNNNNHLVEPPPQSDHIPNELVKSSQESGSSAIPEKLGETPPEFDLILGELMKSLEKDKNSNPIVDKSVGSPPQSDPVVDELVDSFSQPGTIIDVLVESHQQFDPIIDKFVDSLPQPDLITHEFVESLQQSDPIVNELVDSLPQLDHDADELVESHQQSDLIVDELVDYFPQSDPIINELVESYQQFDPKADELVDSLPQPDPITDELVDSFPQCDPIVNDIGKSYLQSDLIIVKNNTTRITKKDGQSKSKNAKLTPKKRGRPRWYETNEEMPFEMLASNMDDTCMSSRGRPKPSENQMQRLATHESSSMGNITPWVVILQTGEDILEKIWVLGETKKQSFWIISAIGVVSDPIVRPSPTSKYVKYEGSYDIIKLSGSFVYHEMYSKKKLGKLTIQLANPDHSVFGGPILPAAPLRAASPIQLILGAFNQEKELNHMNVTTRVSTAYPSVIASLDLPRIPSPPIQVMPMQAEDQYGIRVSSPQTSPSYENVPALCPQTSPSYENVPAPCPQTSPSYENITTPCPQTSPSLNNSRPPAQYYVTFLNLNNLP